MRLEVSDSHAVLSYRSRDGAGSVRSAGRVDDGRRHRVSAVLSTRLASLQMDDEPLEMTSMPSNAAVAATSGVYLGWVPGSARPGFDGCMHAITLGDTPVDDISAAAIDGRDVSPCDRFKRHLTKLHHLARSHKRAQEPEAEALEAAPRAEAHTGPAESSGAESLAGVTLMVMVPLVTLLC